MPMTTTYVAHHQTPDRSRKRWVKFQATPGSKAAVPSLLMRYDAWVDIGKPDTISLKSSACL